MHFPIALFAAALVVDLFLCARFREAWLDRSAVLLYVAGALSAILAAVTGQLAANAAIPALGEETAGLAEAHGEWAFGATVAMFATAAVRFEAFHRDRAAGAPRVHRFRVLALAVAFVAGVVLWETAKRGGALVYRHGVGVEFAETVPGGGRVVRPERP